MIRNLSSNFDENQLFELNKKIVLKNYELVKNAHFNKTVGILDGSGFGHFMKEIMIVSGKINQIIATESIVKKGKELVGAKRILKTVSENYPEIKIDLMLGDALYYTKESFSNCKKMLNAGLLVKFSNPSINVIKDALIYFDEEKNSPDVVRTTGFDSDRMVNYWIETVKNLKADTIDELLSVSRVTEKNPKTGQVEVFYVVTNDLSLKNEEIRYFAHLRWQIENNTFKEMNKILSSKRKYTKDERASRIILSIMCMFFNFFMYFLYVNVSKKEFGIGKTTVLDILQMVYESLVVFYYDSS